VTEAKLDQNATQQQRHLHGSAFRIGCGCWFDQGFDQPQDYRWQQTGAGVAEHSAVRDPSRVFRIRSVVTLHGGHLDDRAALCSRLGDHHFLQ